MRPIDSLFLVIITALPSLTVANTNCDCSRLVEQCGAAISTAGSDIQIRTNTKRCTKVTWYADKKPHDTIVVNGKTREPSSFTLKPFLSVGSCNICASNHPVTTSNSSTKVESEECKKRFLVLIHCFFCINSKPCPCSMAPN